ncbi:MAG TPA: sulfatase-like hydrolase/transferase [Thermoleophilaceae bacterium]|nr:sulfatase-like hydrolase/transferase [Thermoleophilaceae bacterium]
MRACALVLVLLAAVAVTAVLGRDGRAATGERPPVVLLIFDEFPVDALVGPDGRIDAARFPNFARLAESSTWFRGGHTIYDSTTKAVPTILDAKLPRPGSLPGFAGHPENAFTLFDSLGYGVVAAEAVSPLCPPEVCPGSAPTTGQHVLDRLRGTGRPAELRRWIGAMRARRRPTLYVHHALLPHEPWLYLPSGRRSRPGGKDPVGAVNRPIGFHDPRLTGHNHLRHLLQVGFVDRELGLLLRRLRRTGLLDRALLMVVADHGYSFEIGALDRRQVTERNVAQIAPVPFFVKAPGQRTGRIDDRLAATVDVLPTIADLLDVRVPWPHDGRSAFSEAVRQRDVVRIPRRDFSRVVSIGREELEGRRRALRLWRTRKFGSGEESRLFFGDPWASAYRIGPHPDLLGRSVGRLAASTSIRARLANADLVADVPVRGGVYPTRVVGELRGGRPGAMRDLAVAANGRIEAVGRSFRLRGQKPEYFSLMLPETALHPGRNTVEIFEVGGGRLTSVGRF